MEFITIEFILDNLLPLIIFVVLGAFGIYQYITKGKVDNKLIEVTAELAKVTLEKTGILAFFDADKSISETNYETLVNEIPANTWRMNDTNRNLVLDTCTEAERLGIDALIDSYEISSVYGDIQKVYHITTHGPTGGVWRVEYGIPTLITPNSLAYKYLSDEQKIDISKHVEDPISVLNEIALNERNLIKGYSIDANGTIVDVYDGEVTITKA